jgi:hypothetical protein
MMSWMVRCVGVFVLVCSVYCCVVIGAFAFSSGGRVFELVSPSYKEGYGVGLTKAVEPAGESVMFTSLGGFAGALSGGINGSHIYLARRGESGWSTVSSEPAFGGVADVSANLEYVLASGPLGSNAGTANYSSLEEVFQLYRSSAPDLGENWEVFGGIVMKRLDEKHLSAAEESASGDLCHVVVAKAEGPLLAAAEKTNEPIYDLTRGCDGEPPSLRLIGLDNSETPAPCVGGVCEHGKPINRGCPVELGIGRYVNNSTTGSNEQEDAVNAVDAHGDEMFFTTNVQEAGATCAQHGVHLQLFVRLAGMRTVEVSRPFEAGLFGGCVGKGAPGEVPCEGASARANAYFKGASEDGSRVFFTTSAPLVSEDHDTGNDLYMATIGCPGVESSPGAQSCEPSQRVVTSLVLVSHDPFLNEAADVQGVVRLAPDGSRIYFVARGVLGEGPNAQGQAPAKGADNLYVYDSVSHETVFVAVLCSGPSRSGGSEDLHCPRDLPEGGGDAELLWRSVSPEAQSTVDGAFLVFDTYAQLLPGDTDSARDVYRYDTRTGSLERVSVGENAYDANGNNSFDANITFGFMGNGFDWVSLEREMATRAISGDGSRIVFRTVEPLSPAATNGRVNIYEWHDGSVSLISSGTAEEDDGAATIVASGRDVMFTTSQGLVSQDVDGLPDIYDARLEGGFPLLPAERQPCSGDACQGPLTNPAALLVPGSVLQASGGNFPAPASSRAVKKKAKKKRVKGKKRASHRSRRASGAVGGKG